MYLEIEGRAFKLPFATWAGHLAIFDPSGTFTFNRPDPFEFVTNQTSSLNIIVAPMPGNIKHLYVVSGQAVKQDDPVMVLEAMKMEHRLSAPRDGVLMHINVSEGQQVEEGLELAVYANSTSNNE